MKQTLLPYISVTLFQNHIGWTGMKFLYNLSMTLAIISKIFKTRCDVIIFLKRGI